MRTDYSINKRIKALFYVLVTTILVGFILAEVFYPSESELETVSGRQTYEGTLFWEKEDGTKEQITASGTYKVEPGQTMVITTTLPEDYDKSTIEIRGSQQSVRFYIGGELRTEYDTKDTRPFGSDSTSRYVFCRTSGEDAGKELRIELKSNSPRYSGVVNEILCGDKMDILIYLFSIYGGEAMIALFLLFAGIVTIVFSIALSITHRSRINLEYLGWCLVLGATWLLADSKIRQFYIPNASVLSALSFVIVMIAPLPILFYVDSVQQGRYRKLLGAIEYIAVLDLVISNILQIAEIADYLDMLMISQGILGITFFAILVTFFLDYRKGKLKEYLLIVIGILVGLVAVIIESVSVYLVVCTSGIFLGIGLLLLLFCAVLKTLKDIRKLENERNKEQMEKERKQTETMSLQMIQTLSTTIEAKDEYTQGHSYRVAEYSALIAGELGWSNEEIENLKNAANLHDVGKIGVPDIILNKPTKLLDAEYEIIKKHTVIGADILKNITLIDHVEEVARYHHERYDGYGYPEGLSGEDIPIHARIVAVADSYDAMNSRRIYRNPLSPDAIHDEILKNRGTQFDPVVVDAFLKLLDENRLEIEKQSQNVLTTETFSGLETDGTMEAGKFISDVVDTMRNQRSMENMDYLTGLPMRNLGEKQIAQMMQEQEGCLVFLDMDNLKKINDIYGHKAGDRALKLLGDTISNCAGDALACRLGGDEFLLFIQNATKETAWEVVDEIFKSFSARKDADVVLSSADLSGGLCMTQKGDAFADCYTKADKALYYVKQNGKGSFSFYHQIEQNNAGENPAENDLTKLVKMLRQSGSYNGALNLENREFARIYEYLSNLGERYKHTCHLVMITMDAVSDNMMYIDRIEEALGCMEMAIGGNIRNVDICTRYSSMQYLIILMEAGEENISLVIERIFEQYYKLYSGNDFRPCYAYMPMLDQ